MTTIHDGGPPGAHDGPNEQAPGPGDRQQPVLAAPLQPAGAEFRAAPDGRLLEVSPALARMLRYESPARLLTARKSIVQHFSGEPGWWDEIICIMLANHDSLSFETHCWRQDGSLMAAHLHIRILRDEAGRVHAIEGSIGDLTRQRWGETPHTLAMLETISDYVVTTDLYGQVQFGNQAVRRLLAPVAGRDGLSAVNLFDLHPVQVNEQIMCEGMISAVCRGFWSGETTMLRCDGSEVPVWQILLAHTAPDGKVEGFSMIARDISGQKRIEAAGHRLRQEIEQRIAAYGNRPRAISVGERVDPCLGPGRWVEAALAAVAFAAPPAAQAPLPEHLPVGGYVARYDGEALRMLSVGPQFEPMFGFSPDAWTSNPDFWSRLVGPGDRGRVVAMYGRGIARAQPFSIEYRILARGRRVVWVRDEVVPLPTTTDQPRCVYGVMMDVTERKRAESELQTLLPMLRAARMPPSQARHA
ncbi:MAG: PAS domain S-box protein [Chloroflexaceae bacterium]|nr:PAS domain S-box protein [Chloroflexaceae bacterium]